MEIIVLYGMRGTGKSTIGKKLALEKGYDFVDLDNYILENCRKNIDDSISALSEYIDKVGWEEFRNKEHECLKEVLNSCLDLIDKSGFVFSLGGGTVAFQRNIEVLNSPSLIRRGLGGGFDLKIIYLETSLEKIAKRIEQDEKSGNTRNSLTGKSVLEELEEIFEKRKEIYENNCDFSVDNNGTLEETLQEIKQKLNYGGICIPITDPHLTSPNGRGINGIFEIYDKIKFDRRIKFVELRLDLIFEGNYLLPPKIGGKQVSSSPILGDYRGNLNILKELIKKCPKKVICTNRASFEGGKFQGTCEESVEILDKCLEFGADFVDVELKTLEQINNVEMFLGNIGNDSRIGLIISFHNFEKTPSLEELENVLKRMQKFFPKVYKIACMPQEKNDVQKIYDLVEYFNLENSSASSQIDEQNYLSPILGDYRGNHFCFISMGELGLESRIKTLRVKKCFMSFASFGKNISAPGQIDYRELYKQVYCQDKAYSKQNILFSQNLDFHKNFTLENINNLKFSTEIKQKILENKDLDKKVFFLGAEQISGSFSPFMHNYSSSFLWEEKKFFYTLYPVLNSYNKTSEEIVKEFVSFLENNGNYLGGNVTMPYKVDMFKYLENIGRLDEKALLVGAVNTLYKKHKKIFGTNTDIDGVKNPILEKLSFNTSLDFLNMQKINSVILGAGGASRSAIGAMIEFGVKNIYILNRTKENLDEVKNHFSKFLKDGQNIYTIVYDVSEGNFLFEIIEKNSLENLLIINTLPFGFKENLPKSPILFEELEKVLEKTLLYFEAVYDARAGNTPIVEKILEYNNHPQSLLTKKGGNKSKVQICKGAQMLIGQAKTGFEFWSEGGEFKEKFIKESLAES